MSNFICSECGMTNIDCGYAGYKTPKEIELEKENKRLQEQLKEANKALKEVCMHAETEQFECRCGWVEPCKDCNAHYSARNYLKKWGVK